MDIRGNTFSIEASPVQKGQPLFLFPIHLLLALNLSSFYFYIEPTMT